MLEIIEDNSLSDGTLSSSKGADNKTSQPLAPA